MDVLHFFPLTPSAGFCSTPGLHHPIVCSWAMHRSGYFLYSFFPFYKVLQMCTCPPLVPMPPILPSSYLLLFFIGLCPETRSLLWLHYKRKENLRQHGIIQSRLSCLTTKSFLGNWRLNCLSFKRSVWLNSYTVSPWAVRFWSRAQAYTSVAGLTPSCRSGHVWEATSQWMCLSQTSQCVSLT